MNAVKYLLCLLAISVSHHVDGYKYKEPVKCNVKLKSYGYYVPPCTKPVDGYVILNGRKVWEAGWCTDKPNNRGVTIMTVDPVTCTAGPAYLFDTYVSSEAAADLATLLQWIDGGNIVVGVTGDEPSTNLAPALRILKVAGVDVRDVGFRGNFAFVLQKGYPVKTQFVKSTNNVILFSTLEVDIIATFDGKTRSSSGCQCYWDKSRYDCACCYPGFCACGANFRGQCVTCGVGGPDCGQPASYSPVGIEIAIISKYDDIELQEN